MRRPARPRLVARVAAASVAAAALSAPAHGQPLSVSVLGSYRLPGTTTVAGTRVGGLSGIDYRAATNDYLVVSDDRGNNLPGTGPARAYTLAVNVTAGGISGVSVTGVTVLRRPDGTAFPDGTVDPEGVRAGPGGTFYWSSDGVRTADVRADPFVLQADGAGGVVRQFALPDYLRTTPPGNTTTGVGNNAGFESLARSADGTRLYAAAEAPLVQDRALPTPTAGAPVRVLEYDALTGALLAEYVYTAGAVPGTAPTQYAALREMLALGDGRFLTIEHTFSAGRNRNESALYLTSFAGATNVLGAATLVGATYQPMMRELLADLTELGPFEGGLSNLEGMTLGPALADGGRVLLLVGDNGIAANNATQFVALRLGAATAVPEPGTWLLTAAGAGLLAAGRRRRTVRRP